MSTIKYLSAALSVVVLLLAVPTLGMILARQPALARSGAAIEARSAAPHGDSTDAQALVGVLLPTEMANLSAREDLKVLGVRVKVGQRVRRGDVIVAFDLRSRDHDLAIAQAQLRAARAEASAARAGLAAATKRLARRGTSVAIGGESLALVSAEESAQARYEKQTAGARMQTAFAHIAEQKARVEQLRLSLAESDLRAPFVGVVSALYVEPGATAHAGEVVARVVGGSGLRVRIAAPQESPELLRARRARIVEDDGRVLFARIDRVPPEPESISRMFIVEGEVDHVASACGNTPGCPALADRPVRVVLLYR